jgi:hypothetical protein
MANERPFLSTLPGILTGIAGCLTGIVGLLGLALSQGWIGGGDGNGATGSNATTTTAAGGTTQTTSAGTGTTRPASGTPRFRVDPTTIDFGTTTGTDRPLTVRNEGSTPLTVQSPRLSGTNPDQFEVSTGTCTIEVRAGDSCQLQVRFTPNRGGPQSAIVEVRVAGADEAQVRVTGSRGIL